MRGSDVMKYEEIRERIYTIRGLQVMIDRDLASLYGVETRTLNQAVKRNGDRFPGEYCFQLDDEEFANWKSQIVISNKDRMGLRKHPYAFTEQGVAMLSAVLKSETAVTVSVRIINAFVAMRKFITANARIFQRLDAVEQKQIAYKAETDEKFDRIFNAIESKEITPKQGVFFEGQIFDAYKFISDLIRSADRSIILIDNYVDDTVLTLFSKRKKGVSLTVLTGTVTKQLSLDIRKHNEQFPTAEVRRFAKSHDRFLIIDDAAVYHVGASLKDLGKKWFAFSKMDAGAIEMLARLKEMKADG